MYRAPLSWLSPPPQRSLAEQLASLTPEQHAAFTLLKEFCESQNFTYKDAFILRLIRCSPGTTKFNVEAAKRVAIRHNDWTERLNMQMSIALERGEFERRGKTCFPGCYDVDGNLVLFMEPRVYIAGRENIVERVRGMLYLFDCVSELEDTSINGIAVVMLMTGWGPRNWGITESRYFFESLTGRYPLRIRKFYFVNAPTYAHVCWSIMKVVLPTVFVNKVKFCSLEAAKDIFPGPEHVPKDLGGDLDVQKALSEFTQYRCAKEGIMF